MPHLADVYGAALSRDPGGPIGPTGPTGPVDPIREASTLESALAALCARGHAAHPDLPVADADFVAHLARCGASVAIGTGALHAEDLFLACAALIGIGTAVERLRHDQRPAVAGYLRHVSTERPLVEEIEQRLWEMLLVGSSASPAKLATYTGKGPLSAFVGITAQRIALDGRRRRAAEGRAIAGMAAEVRAVAGDTELAFTKWRYREEFQQAVADALGTLDDRGRMILRLHIVDGLTLDQIAKFYSVRQPTVSRWLARTRELVLDETRRLLRERLLLPESEFDSIAGLVVSQLDLSVSRILRGTP